MKSAGSLARLVIHPIVATVQDGLEGYAHKAADNYGPPLTEEMVLSAEAKLGLKLPQSYIEFCRECNGGLLHSEFYEFGEAEIYFASIAGMGYEGGIDAEFGSPYMIQEWGYPSPAVWLGGDGHTAVLLDYRTLEEGEEPPVIWVDTESDGSPHTVQIADCFLSFVEKLADQVNSEITEDLHKAADAPQFEY